MTTSRQPKGTPIGGQYAASQHPEPSVDLFSAEGRPLTEADVKWAQDLTGTYYADGEPGYYPMMGRIFDAARNHVESTPQGRREKALNGEALKLSEILSIPAQEIRHCYGKISEAAANGKDEREEEITWCSDFLNTNRANVTYIERQMKAADPGPRRLDPFYDKLARIENTPIDELEEEELAYLVTAEANHNLNPAIGWIRGHREDFDEHERVVASLQERMKKVGPEVARKLFDQKQPVDEWGLPRIKGFTADDVEAHLQDEQHQNLCACILKDNICATYGEGWRGKTAVANVHAVFEAMTEMAAARSQRSESRYGG